MPTYIVTLKENAPTEELEKAKQQVRDNGGKITHEYSLIKGFSAEYPEEHIGVLQANEHLAVEADQEMKTQ